MRPSGSKDYFGSFLEAADGPDQEKSGNAAGSEASAEKALLTELSSLQEPISLKELISRLSFPPSLTVSAIHQLADAKLVELREAQDDELVQLTPLGRKIGALA